MYAVESPECWFEDFGFGRLADGQAEVRLDEDFVAVIGEGAYHVFLSEYDGDSSIHVTDRDLAGFRVEGAPGSTSEFSYRVVGKRLDVDVARFAPLPPRERRTGPGGQPFPDRLEPTDQADE